MNCKMQKTSHTQCKSPLAAKQSRPSPVPRTLLLFHFDASSESQLGWNQLVNYVHVAAVTVRRHVALHAGSIMPSPCRGVIEQMCCYQHTICLQHTVLSFGSSYYSLAGAMSSKMQLLLQCIHRIRNIAPNPVQRLLQGHVSPEQATGRTCTSTVR